MNAHRGPDPEEPPKWEPVGLESLAQPLPAHSAPAVPEHSGSDGDDAARWLGQVLAGRYRVIEQLGEGGFAWVFRAERIGRVKGDVAIKILKPETAESRGTISRFLKEADAIAKVQHPNVVHLIEFGELEDGGVFIVMDCLRGKPLQDMLKEIVGRGEVFSWERLGPLMQQASDALQAAHDVELVHRDVKPNNIFVCRPETKAPYVKLLDFGIAKGQPKRTSGGSIETPLTQEGVFLGTPHYAAPEIILGQAPEGGIDGRVDIFSLGVVMYQCLTGTLPFQQVHHNTVSVLYHTAHTRPQSLRERAPERNIPAEVDALVMRAMELRADARYHTADELSEAIKATLKSAALTPERSGQGSGVRSGSIVEIGQAPVRDQIVKSAPERIIVTKRPVSVNLETPIQGNSTNSGTAKSPTVPQDTGRRTSLGVYVVLALMVVGLLVLFVFIIYELQSPAPARERHAPVPTVPAKVGPPQAGPRRDG